MSTYVTKGFILNVKPWREGDRLYTLLTDYAGKVEAVATGSRKVSSKLSPHLAPFSEISLMLARGRQYDRLASAYLLQTYVKPPFELPTVVLGSALLEIADSLTRLGERDAGLINLLRQSFLELKDLPSEDQAWRKMARGVLANYLIELFKLTGLAITLTHCEGCRRELLDPAVFSWTNHGFYHKNHLPPGSVATLISTEALEWLIRAAGPGVNRSAPLSSSVLAFLTNYLTSQIGGQLYTIKVLRSIL